MGPNQLLREIFNEITKEYKGGKLPNQLQRKIMSEITKTHERCSLPNQLKGVSHEIFSALF